MVVVETKQVILPGNISAPSTSARCARPPYMGEQAGRPLLARVYVEAEEAERLHAEERGLGCGAAGGREKCDLRPRRTAWRTFNSASLKAALRKRPNDSCSALVRLGEREQPHRMVRARWSCGERRAVTPRDGLARAQRAYFAEGAAGRKAPPHARPRPSEAVLLPDPSSDFQHLAAERSNMAVRS